MTLQVSLIGTGYMGSAHAAGMAEFGHHVVGLDVDRERDAILTGRSQIDEVCQAAGGEVTGVRIAVLGAAFKPCTVRGGALA